MVVQLVRVVQRASAVQQAKAVHHARVVQQAKVLCHARVLQSRAPITYISMSFSILVFRVLVQVRGFTANQV